MGTQRLVARGQIRPRLLLEIAERRREAVAAVFLRYAAESPQGVLQTLGQSDEALAAQHHLGMLPAGERQTEVIEPVIERDTGDADAEIGHVGEVRQSLLTGRMLLAKDHLPLRAMLRLPGRGSAAPACVAFRGKPACRLQSRSGDRLSPGAALSIGTISLSQTSANGSARRRSRRALLAGKPGINIEPEQWPC